MYIHIVCIISHHSPGKLIIVRLCFITLFLWLTEIFLVFFILLLILWIQGSGSVPEKFAVINVKRDERKWEKTKLILVWCRVVINVLPYAISLLCRRLCHLCLSLFFFFSILILLLHCSLTSRKVRS